MIRLQGRFSEDTRNADLRDINMIKFLVSIKMLQIASNLCVLFHLFFSFHLYEPKKTAEIPQKSKKLCAADLFRVKTERQLGKLYGEMIISKFQNEFAHLFTLLSSLGRQ